MRSLRTLSVALSLLTLFQTGCAALNLKSLGIADPEDSAGDSTAQEDPIAAVAARYRSPAGGSHAGADAEGAPAHGRMSFQRSEHIALGMGMAEVVQVWGEPSDVETAGDTRNGNQRWTYFSGITSRWGLGARRVVYFESGQVSGWKTLQ